MAIDEERYSNTSRRVMDLVEAIVERYEDFDYYRDTTYRNLARPAVFWPDGKSVGYGYASRLSGSANRFFQKFRYWGFDDVEDFFSLPLVKRNEFLKNGKAVWEAVFREKQFQEKTLEDILNIEKLDYQRQEEILSLLNYAEETFHAKLVEEAKRIKNECYSNRQLRWHVRNEKARFKAEDKLRERTQHIYGGSCLGEEIQVWWFQLQEGLKRLVGLRETFPPK